MVHFVGAGPGAPDLITQRGAALLQTADCIIYAGSLVNPVLLGLAKADCTIYNSAKMTLEDVISVMRENEKNNRITVRLHTGDPCLYGAIREQMDVLDAESIPYDDTPGVSSFCGAAAALNAEYTLPSVSQTVIITRMEGRTPVPEKEKLQSLAAHGADHGDFPFNRFGRSGAAGAFARRRLHELHPRSSRLQSHVAGGKNCALYCRWFGQKCVHKADSSKTALIVIEIFSAYNTTAVSSTILHSQRNIGKAAKHELCIYRFHRNRTKTRRKSGFFTSGQHQSRR